MPLNGKSFNQDLTKYLKGVYINEKFSSIYVGG